MKGVRTMKRIETLGLSLFAGCSSVMMLGVLGVFFARHGWGKWTVLQNMFWWLV